MLSATTSTFNEFSNGSEKKGIYIPCKTFSLLIYINITGYDVYVYFYYVSLLCVIDEVLPFAFDEKI